MEDLIMLSLQQSETMDNQWSWKERQNNVLQAAIQDINDSIIPTTREEKPMFARLCNNL